MNIIPVADFVDKLKAGESMTILDVRTKEEWDSAHLPGNVIHIPVQVFTSLIADDIKQQVGDEPLYILCRLGPRAVKAAGFLHQHGMKNLYIVDGGMDGCAHFGADIIHGDGVDTGK